MPNFTEAEQALIRARRYYFTGKLVPQEPVICNGYPGKVIRLYSDGPYEAGRMYEVRLASGPVCVCGSDLVPENFDLKY